MERNRGSSHPGAAIRWLSRHRNSTGCCRRGHQGAWSGRRQKLHWPPRPALTLNSIRTAGVERRDPDVDAREILLTEIRKLRTWPVRAITNTQDVSLETER